MRVARGGGLTHLLDALRYEAARRVIRAATSPVTYAGRNTMPLFMDIHRHVDGLTADAVAGAHAKDLEVQHKHGVDYKHYWFNEKDGTVMCLVDAPSREAAAAVEGAEPSVQSAS
jgi:hypothetical protein